MWREIKTSAETEELCGRLHDSLLREFRFATVRAVEPGGLPLIPGNGLWLLIQGNRETLEIAFRDLVSFEFKDSEWLDNPNLERQENHWVLSLDGPARIVAARCFWRVVSWRGKQVRYEPGDFPHEEDHDPTWLE